MSLEVTNLGTVTLCCNVVNLWFDLMCAYPVKETDFVSFLPVNIFSAIIFNPDCFSFCGLNQFLSDMLLDLSDLLQVSFKTMPRFRLGLQLMIIFTYNPRLQSSAGHFLCYLNNCLVYKTSVNSETCTSVSK